MTCELMPTDLSISFFLLVLLLVLGSGGGGWWGVGGLFF